MARNSPMFRGGAVDAELGKRGFGRLGHGLQAGAGCVHDDLGQQRIVSSGGDVPGVAVGVDSHARTGGHLEGRHGADGRMGGT